MDYIVTAAHRSEFPQPITLGVVCAAGGRARVGAVGEGAGCGVNHGRGQSPFLRKGNLPPHPPGMARRYRVQPMVSIPPMYGRSTSGTVMVPSAFW